MKTEIIDQDQVIQVELFFDLVAAVLFAFFILSVSFYFSLPEIKLFIFFCFLPICFFRFFLSFSYWEEVVRNKGQLAALFLMINLN